MKLIIEDFNTHQAIEDVLLVFAESARRKNLKLIHAIGDSVPAHLRGDPDRLRQILTNLIGNAIKFTDQGIYPSGRRQSCQSNGSA